MSRHRSALVAVAVAGILLVSVGFAATTLRPRSGSATSPVPSAVAATTIPSLALPPSPGGISQDRAVALAREHVAPGMTFVSASAGWFADLLIYAVGPGDPVKPDHEVWAVTFEGDFVICPPTEPPPCWTPRPGTTRVFLDYATGEWLTNQSFSPR